MLRTIFLGVYFLLVGTECNQVSNQGVGSSLKKLAIKLQSDYIQPIDTLSLLDSLRCPRRTYDIPSAIRVSAPKIAAKIRLGSRQTGGNPASQTLTLEGGFYKYALETFAAVKNTTIIPVESTGGGTGLLNATTGVWNGAVGDILSNRADIGIVTAMTYQRFQVVQFSHAIEYQEMLFVIGKPQRIYTWKTIWWPFRPSLWLAICFSGVLVIVALSQMPKGSLFHHFTYLKTGWGTSINLTVEGLLQESGRLPRGHYARTVYVLWLLLALNIGALYKSKFFSLLTIPITDEAPRTFETLANSDYNTGLHYLGGAAYQLIMSSKSPALTKIRERNLERISGPTKCYEKAAKIRKTACIGWNGFIEFVLASSFSDKYGNNPFLVSTAPAFVSPLAFSMRKESGLEEPLNGFVLHAVAGGLAERWRDLDLENVRRISSNKWSDSNSSSLEVYGTDESAIIALSLNHLVGGFSLLFVGFSVTAVVFLCEMIIGKRKKLVPLSPNTVNDDESLIKPNV